MLERWIVAGPRGNAFGMPKNATQSQQLKTKQLETERARLARRLGKVCRLRQKTFIGR